MQKPIESGISNSPTPTFQVVLDIPNPRIVGRVLTRSEMDQSAVELFDFRGRSETQTCFRGGKTENKFSRSARKSQKPEDHSISSRLTGIQADQTVVQDPLRPLIADGAHEDLQHDCPEDCQTSVKDAVEHADFGFGFLYGEKVSRLVEHAKPKQLFENQID